MASASGYVLNFAGQTPALVDATGESWTLIAGAVAPALLIQVNGVTDNTATNPQQLLYYNNLVYYQNTSNQWFSKAKAADPWVAAPVDPRTVSSSPSGYILNFAGQTPPLVDAIGESWTLIAGAVAPALLVQVNGVTDTTAVNPQQLLYFNNLVYYQNASNQWFHKAKSADPWVADAADPRPAGGPATAASVLAFLNSIVGKHVVSGQFTEIKGLAQIQPGGAIDTIHNQTGKWLGMIGGDYWYYSSTQTSADITFNAAAISYWNSGGMITLIFSFPNPTSGGASYDRSSLDTSGILTPGTATNNRLISLFDSIAAGLQALQTAGVIVLLRPWHEFNGNWFWWGTPQSGDPYSFLSDAQFVALWQKMHDYFVNTKGLTNLLWLWSANSGVTGSYPVNNRYPGDAYVDLTGLDVYTSDPAGSMVSDYNLMLSAHPSKPLTFSEFGPHDPSSGDPNFNETILTNALKNNFPKVVMFQQWWAPWGIELVQNTTAALGDPWVYNRGDFSLSGGATFTPSPDKSIVLAGSTATLVDSVGNVWGINAASAQVTKNSVIDTTTANVAEIAYVSSVIWHKNTSGQWYSWNGTAWVGPQASPLPSDSPNGTIITVGNGGSITDTGGHVWTISGTGTNGQVTYDGRIDTGSNFIIEMAYVNSVVWAEDGTNTWYSTTGFGVYGPGTKTSPLGSIGSGLWYIKPMASAGLRVITAIKQQSPAGFTTGLASLRAEQSANRDIVIYEGCEEPDTAVITGTPETLADGASFQQTVWAAGQSDGLPVIQTSFGVLADYGTTGNLSAFATYGNAHTYPGAQNSTANYAATVTGGFMTALTNAALLTSPGRGIAHTEFGGWLADHNSATAIASYVLDFVMSGFFDLNLPYMIVQGLYDDSKNGQVGLYNNDQTPRLVATGLTNFFSLLKDTSPQALSFGPGKLNVAISNLPASPSGALMGGKFGVLQKADGSFWILVRNEQNLTTPDANNHTAITVANVSCVVTLGTLATSINVYDPLVGTTPTQTVNNSSSFTLSLPSHPVLIKIVRP